jgi:predicted kinase
MEAVIFVGIQASGKSTFYTERFFDTHVRINLDMLRTRHREKLLLAACLEGKQPFVVDNTNPTHKERARYVGPALEHGFRVVGYYFRSRVGEAIRRDQFRPAARQVPPRGIGGTAKRLELPSLDEGFATLYYVRIDEHGRFVVEPWVTERSEG